MEEKSDIITPSEFIDEFIHRSELDKPFHLIDFQREILDLAFQFDENGKLPYDTILYSTIKKSGKTTFGGILALYVALFLEDNGEVLLCANDQEQSLARTYATCEKLIEYNPELKEECEVRAKVIFCRNGSEIKALSNDYRSESGANFTGAFFDELWAFTAEGSRRLFEELTPVATRLNSIRVITTYAGFSGESELLWDLYKQGVGKEEHPEGQGEKIHPTLPLYVNRAAKIFAFWDHEKRLPWQLGEDAETYFESQRRTLRPATFQRYHLNQWVSSENSFITPEIYDACVVHGRQNLRGYLFIGVDAAVRRDCAAVVAIRYADENDDLVLADYKIWTPLPGQPINLESSIEFYLRRIYNLPSTFIAKILVDPFQMARSVQTLQASGLPIEEYNQTTQNLTESTEALYSAFHNQRLRLYHAPDLREHCLNAVSVETPRGIRLAKAKTSKKVDGCLALSFAVLAAIQYGKPPPTSNDPYGGAGGDSGGYKQDWDARFT